MCILWMIKRRDPCHLGFRIDGGDVVVQLAVAERVAVADDVAAFVGRRNACRRAM